MIPVADHPRLKALEHQIADVKQAACIEDDEMADRAFDAADDKLESMAAEIYAAISTPRLRTTETSTSATKSATS